jgi:hypothetical protein
MFKKASVSREPPVNIKKDSFVESEEEFPNGIKEELPVEVKK